MKPRTILKHSIAALLGAALHTAASAADFTATWNGTTGNWSDFTKWNILDVPDNGSLSPTFDVVHNSGTLTLDQFATIQKLTMGGGTNNGLGFTLTINELFTFSGATLGGTGNVEANGGVTFNGGTKTITGGRNLKFGGNSTWSAGNINIVSSGAITNQAGFTFDNSFDGTMQKISGAATFNNAGIFTKSAGAGSTTLNSGMVLNNTGTVNVNSGTLALGGGGTHANGIFNVSSGTTLDFSGDTHALSGTASVAGSGTGIVKFSGGTVNFNAGSYSVAGTTQISGGTANFNAAAATNLLTISGSGILGGTATLTASGLTTFSGGTMTGAGTIQANGGVTFNGSGKTIGGRSLNLGGNSTWSAGDINIVSSGAITNQAGFTFDTNFDGSMNNSTGAATFNNAGIFTKSAGAGTTTIRPALNNTGTVNVNSGTLALSNSNFTQTHTNGIFNVSNGTTLDFSGGTHVLNGAASVAGSGTGIVKFSSGTVNFNAGTYSVAGTTEINGGTANFNAAASTNLLTISTTLGGTATLTASGLTTFSGGIMTGAGTTQANGGVTFNSTGQKNINGGRVLNLGGNSTWSAGTIDVSSSGVITNQAGFTFDTNFDGSMNNNTGAATFNNQGIFTKSAGAGTTTIRPVLNNTGTVNANSGTLTLTSSVTQHSGTTLTAGIWNVTNGSTLNITSGSNIQTIGSGATVKLSGAGSSFAKVTTELNNNQGIFHLANNRDLTTAGNLANSGTLRVEDVTTLLTVNGILNQSAGNTNLVNGGSITANAFNLNGGFLSGTGNVTLATNGDLIAANGAKISPGNSAGNLAINLSGSGDFDISAAVSAINSDALVFEMGTVLTSDRITITGGPLTIGNGLLEFDDFDFSTLFDFVGGTTYTLFDGDTAINGTLGTNLSGLIAGVSATISLADSNRDLVVTIAPVPEPGTAIFGIACIGVAALRRHRRA